jgi:hypothetical protein
VPVAAAALQTGNPHHSRFPHKTRRRKIQPSIQPRIKLEESDFRHELCRRESAEATQHPAKAGYDGITLGVNHA